MTINPYSLPGRTILDVSGPTFTLVEPFNGEGEGEGRIVTRYTVTLDTGATFTLTTDGADADMVEHPVTGTSVCTRCSNPVYQVAYTPGVSEWVDGAGTVACDAPTVPTVGYTSTSLHTPTTAGGGDK